MVFLLWYYLDGFYTLKFEEIHHEAKHIDRLIDLNIHAKGSLFLSTDELQTIILTVYPHYYVESCGWHKIVFRHKTLNNKVVLKVGSKKSIENDHQAYKRVPKRMRHVFLQEYIGTQNIACCRNMESSQCNPRTA